MHPKIYFSFSSFLFEFEEWIDIFKMIIFTFWLVVVINSNKWRLNSWRFSHGKRTKLIISKKHKGLSYSLVNRYVWFLHLLSRANWRNSRSIFAIITHTNKKKTSWKSILILFMETRTWVAWNWRESWHKK